MKNYGEKKYTCYLDKVLRKVGIWIRIRVMK